MLIVRSDAQVTPQGLESSCNRITGIEGLRSKSTMWIFKLPLNMTIWSLMLLLLTSWPLSSMGLFSYPPWHAISPKMMMPWNRIWGIRGISFAARFFMQPRWSYSSKAPAIFGLCHVILWWNFLHSSESNKSSICACCQNSRSGRNPFCLYATSSRRIATPWGSSTQWLQQYQGCINLSHCKLKWWCHRKGWTFCF